MNHIRFFEDIAKNDVGIAGGKGASLGEMRWAGIPVPSGFVILASAFDRFVGETQLKEEIAARLGEVRVEDMNSIERASAVLRDAIHDTPVPPDLQKEIVRAFEQLACEYVAVRSSATAEDSSIASWAGELETYLNTTREHLVDNVKLCWSSLFTPRAIFYRQEKNLIDAKVSVAVVIQTMVQSEISGVAFTVHPVTEDYDQIIIEACYGLGEALVGGLVTPDSYVVSKKGMSIVGISIGEQTRKLARSPYHPITLSLGETTTEANRWIELLPEEAKKQKLTGKQIIELAELCLTIETHYGFPCDIEWALAEGQFFITQSRPITTLKKRVERK